MMCGVGGLPCGVDSMNCMRRNLDQGVGGSLSSYAGSLLSSATDEKAQVKE